ncbi:TPA: isoprenylcysteine carboxylmethyltransferase family protein [Candidatus Poribacteria bacterium]|nr:isoprenylcysteine carboxylmethyltransferase family protein [Candidatus Poribacteria bacterium]HEX28582.1 isoprenylcysteine carboxylmethyltransferase family protein [Candidatus Poribacteria bacterium]
MEAERIGRILFRVRGYTPIPFIALAVFFSKAGFASIAIGLMFVMAGESMRIWSVGYAGARTRARSLGAARDLVTAGPYAYTRNPIYIGNILIAFGFSVMSNLRLLMLLSAIWFPLQYWLIVRAEEEYLLKEFGWRYERYLQNVPRFLFRATPYLHRSNHDFSLRRAVKSERQTLIGITLLAVLIFLSARYPLYELITVFIP